LCDKTKKYLQIINSCQAGNDTMDGIPNRKNIRALLHEGFSLNDLHDLCFDEPKLKPIYDNWAEIKNKNEFIRQMIDYALNKFIVDLILEAARERNPPRFEHHKPYFFPDPTLETVVQQEIPGESVGKVLLDNDLGKGILLGGIYENIPLQIVAHNWADYGGVGWVRSGWLFIPQWTPSHAVAFFKIHVLEDGTGYIHLVDVSHPAHTIWLVTRDGLKFEDEFHYITHPAEVWQF
jgi:hypothetical protein